MKATLEHVMYDCARYSEERKELILYLYKNAKIKDIPLRNKTTVYVNILEDIM